MKISQLLSGWILFLAGIVMIVISFFKEGDVLFVLLFYGIPLFLIGIAILFNSKEDNIEQVKKKSKDNVSKRKHKGGKNKK